MAAIKRSLNVGTVGQGNIGTPITRNLAFKARSAMYLQIHSRSMQKARRVCDDLAVDGATCAMRLHDRYDTLTKWCDVILLTLHDVRASRSVLLERADALIPNARKGQIIVDHTTVDVETSRECAYEAEKRGAVFLDAPLSGSPKAAFNGQLVVMVGGDKEGYQRMLPLFRMYSDTIHHMGSSGSGSAAKMISEALIAVHSAAAAEAMRLAHQLGIEDHRTLLQLLDASWGSSSMLRRNAGSMQDLLRNPDKVPPTSGANVDRMLHDLGLLAASIDSEKAAAMTVEAAMHSPSARTMGTDPPAHSGTEGGIEYTEYPLLATSMRVFEAASDAGVGDRDLSAVVQYVHAGAIAAKEDQVQDILTRHGAATAPSTEMAVPPSPLRDGLPSLADGVDLSSRAASRGGSLPPPPPMDLDFY